MEFLFFFLFFFFFFSSLFFPFSVSSDALSFHPCPDLLAGGSGLGPGGAINANQPATLAISSGAQANAPRFVSAGFDNMIRV
jgi:hypothetical protein